MKSASSVSSRSLSLAGRPNSAGMASWLRRKAMRTEYSSKLGSASSSPQQGEIAFHRNVEIGREPLTDIWPLPVWPEENISTTLSSRMFLMRRALHRMRRWKGKGASAR